MKRHLLLLLVFILGGLPSLRAQSASGGVFNVDSLRAAVRYLASDGLTGRRTGTPGNEEAARYLAGKFSAAGLATVPGGTGGGYLHGFSYLAGVTIGSRNALEVKGRDGKMIAAKQGPDFSPAGFSSSGSADAPVAFAGYGITAKELSYDDYAGIDAKGKIVLIMRRSPDGDNPHGGFARFEGLTAKVSNAREHGAAAIIFINQPDDSSALPSAHFDRNFTHADIPAIIARASLFDGIRNPGGESLAALQMRIDRDRKPASFVSSGFTARLRTDVSLQRQDVPNVIGMLRGHDPALGDQIIVIGGHFDHLGWGGEGSLYGGKEPSIHHGADDNASGAAGVIALADRFARMGNNGRTLIFVAFNGEEEGLLGSAALMEKPPFDAAKVVAMVNMDMIGRLDTSLIVQGTGTSPLWKDLLGSTNAGRFPLKMVEDGFGPSDHSSFYSKGIPVLFFFTGLHSDYHRPSDTWEKINYPGEMRVLDYVADVVRAIDRHAEPPLFTRTQNSAERGNMGFKVYVGTIPDYAFDGKGLRLTGVAEGGPAQKGGLKGGDIIIGIGGKQVNNIYDYTYALGEFRPKQIVEVEYLRDGARMTTKVELGSR